MSTASILRRGIAVSAAALSFVAVGSVAHAGKATLDLKNGTSRIEDDSFSDHLIHCVDVRFGETAPVDAATGQSTGRAQRNVITCRATAGSAAILLLSNMAQQGNPALKATFRMFAVDQQTGEERVAMALDTEVRTKAVSVVWTSDMPVPLVDLTFVATRAVTVTSRSGTESSF